MERPTGRARLAGPDAPADGMAQRDRRAADRAFKKFRLALAKCDAPILGLAQASGREDQYLRAALGSARPSTVSKRLRHWESFHRYLAAHGKPRWPSGPGDIISYLHDLVEGAVARTVPGDVVAAIAWMEERTGVPEEQKHSRDSMVSRTKEWALTVLESQAEGTRRALQVPLAVVVALGAWAAVSL